MQRQKHLIAMASGRSFSICILALLIQGKAWCQGNIPVTDVTEQAPDAGSGWSNWRSDGNSALSFRSRCESTDTVALQVRFDATDGACSAFWSIGKDPNNSHSACFRWT